MKKDTISTKFELNDDFRYPLFLFSLLTFLFLPSFFGEALIEIITNICFIFMLFSSLILIDTQNVLKRNIILLTGIIVISGEVLNLFFEIGLFLSVVIHILLFIYFIIIEHELLVQVFSIKIINLQVVLGAFTGYILIGIIASFLFRGVYAVWPESFNINGNPLEDLMYYSFITLTTIGYGDISPLTSVSRNIAILLGLIGQFYTAIIMAFIIGKFLQHSD